ncbi:hypothetical protein [Desulfatirhabdium butyrativorans]|jgi:ABC-type phosphonate transport system ATPase subunit|uniref:hypothetical protein n=1 Tax=Desulfatirhabdium butyrativorans TaxID=340467 RepID=UPI000409EB86|nr:hypothetical protein [Desulfatirhabdium butyrativorans]
MLVASHDLGVINLLCQRTMVMKSGHVVASGPTDQILPSMTLTLVSPSEFLV